MYRILLVDDEYLELQLLLEHCQFQATAGQRDGWN